MSIIDKLGGEKGAERFLRDELSVSETSSWPQKGGVIYFKVTSDGTTREDWGRLDSNGSYSVGPRAREALCSLNFRPTIGATYEVAVLKGSLFRDDYRSTDDIRAQAKLFRTPDGRRLCTPSVELACLIRKTLTDEEIEAMDLSQIIAMHMPINDSDGDPVLLGARCNGGGRGLSANIAWPSRRWSRNDGFAFAVSPKVSS